MSSQEHTSNKKGSFRQLRRIVGALIALGCLGILGQAIYTLFQRVGEQPLVPTWTTGGLALLAAFSWLFAHQQGWHFIVRRMAPDGLKLRWLETCRSFCMGQLGRFLPGKVWLAVVKVESLAYRVPRPDVWRGVIYEQANLIAATLAVGLGMSPYLLLHFGLPPLVAGGVLLAVLAALVVWLFFPRLLSGPLNAAARKLLKNPDLEPLKLPPRRVWLGAFGCLLVVCGTEFLRVLPLWWSLGPSVFDDPGTLILALAAYPLARLIGQAGFFVPSGLGVREGAYILLLQPILDPVAAGAVALWARLLSMVAEAVFYAVIMSLPGGRIAKPEQPGPEASREAVAAPEGEAPA